MVPHRAVLFSIRALVRGSSKKPPPPLIVGIARAPCRSKCHGWFPARMIMGSSMIHLHLCSSPKHLSLPDFLFSSELVLVDDMYRVAKRNATRKWREIDLQLPCWLLLTLLG